jgi:SAM-dependent methyltransferase
MTPNGAPARQASEDEIVGAVDVDFLLGAAREFGDIVTVDGLQALDFGCGLGALVQALRDGGLDARGCDFPDKLGSIAGLDPISVGPYRLPYDDSSFDLVVSASVLEHAQNTAECFAEIHRVLRPGGVAIHGFPGKWYLPTEPHIYVPLVSWTWPKVSRIWLALWAILGVRNEFQRGKPWREVTALNLAYVRDRICYRTSGEYGRLSDRIFGNHEWATDFYIEHAQGGAATLARLLPFRSVTGRIIREIRFSYLVQRRT